MQFSIAKAIQHDVGHDVLPMLFLSSYTCLLILSMVHSIQQLVNCVLSVTLRWLFSITFARGCNTLEASLVKQICFPKYTGRYGILSQNSWVCGYEPSELPTCQLY